MNIPNTPNTNIVLVIDDQAENLKVIVDALDAADLITVVARSGEEGLQRAKFACPDLILLDVMMPGMDGFETCRCLKADPLTQAIPIIFLTVLEDVADKVHGFECGAVDYVTKPVHVPELLARVKAHLTIRTLQRELETQNAELETRVQARTADLQAEVERRKQREQEHLHLMEMLRNQSEQLRILSQTLAQQNTIRQEEMVELLHGQVVDYLDRLESRLQMLWRWQVQHKASDARSSQHVEYLEESLALLQASKSWLHQLQEHFAAPSSATDEDPLLQLSAREQEVAHLLIAGKTSPEIAELLHLSVHTIRTYRQRLMKKLEVDSVQALLKLVMG